MWAIYMVVAAWRGSRRARFAGRSRRLAARVVRALAVPGTERAGRAGERQARFEQEARSAARAWLMV